MIRPAIDNRHSVIGNPPAADWSAVSPEDLLVEHVGRTENTSRAYAGDLRRFAAFIGATGNVEAVRQLVSMPRGQVVLTLRSYQRHVEEVSKSDHTVRRYLASLLKLLRLAHELDVIQWAIRYKLPSPPATPAVRQRRIPSREQILDMISIAQRREDAKGDRDFAMLHLLYYSALRLHEVLSLDVDDVDLALRVMSVKTKGRRQRETRPIAAATAGAIEKWLGHRGDASGPLFTGLEWRMVRAGRMERLSVCGLYDVVHKLGRRVGLEHCSPHLLRHSAATHLAALTNGNLLLGIALTGHRDPKTYLVYNNDQALQMRAATEILVSGQWTKAGEKGW